MLNSGHRNAPERFSGEPMPCLKRRGRFASRCRRSSCVGNADFGANSSFQEHFSAVQHRRRHPKVGVSYETGTCRRCIRLMLLCRVRAEEPGSTLVRQAREKLILQLRNLTVSRL